MTQQHNYQPISCDFHDILEDAAVRRLRVEVAFNSEGGEQVNIGRIKDITVEGQEEFLIMEDGLKLRLDQLIRVDQQTVADYTGELQPGNDVIQGNFERPLMKQPPKKAS